MAYHFHEPLGVVGQIIPWNFPILMAAWKLAPALAAGNCVVLKPAEQTPLGIMVLIELIGDLLPPGVLNVVNGFGHEAGKPLATSKRIAKIAFTGSTATGRAHHAVRRREHHSVHGGTGRQVAEHLLRRHAWPRTTTSSTRPPKAWCCAFFNQGEVCTCPSRALVQESIYDRFMERVMKKVRRSSAATRWTPTPWSAPRRRSSSSTRSCRTWKSPRRKAPSC